jgi:hypothetical protein
LYKSPLLCYKNFVFISKGFEEPSFALLLFPFALAVNKAKLYLLTRDEVEILAKRKQGLLVFLEPRKKLYFFIDKPAVRQNEILPLLDKTKFYLTSLC